MVMYYDDDNNNREYGWMHNDTRECRYNLMLPVAKSCVVFFVCLLRPLSVLIG
jgi:hypothetical protein